MLPDCIPPLLQLARRRITGVLNVANPGTSTLHRLREIYCNIVGAPTDQWTVVKGEQAVAMLGKKPVVTLDTRKFEELCAGLLSVQLPSVEESIATGVSNANLQ